MAPQSRRVGNRFFIYTSKCFKNDPKLTHTSESTNFEEKDMALEPNECQNIEKGDKTKSEKSPPMRHTFKEVIKLERCLFPAPNK
jgi:hypothetical protein